MTTAPKFNLDYYAKLVEVTPPESHALTGGRWVNHRGIMRWVADPRPVNEPVNVHLLISCPLCRARVDQTCKTKSGNPRTPHVIRLTARLCPCGATLGYKKTLCEDCRRAQRRATYLMREHRQPTSKRRRTLKPAGDTRARAISEAVA